MVSPKVWSLLRIPLALALIIYCVEEVGRARREYGDCVRRVARAKRVAVQPECQTHDGLTRIDNDFIKCQTATAVVDEEATVCAARRWIRNGWWVKVVTATHDLSYSIIVAMVGVALAVVYMAIQGIVADRHNQRGARLLEAIAPIRQQQQQPLAHYPPATVQMHHHHQPQLAYAHRPNTEAVVPYWEEIE